MEDVLHILRDCSFTKEIWHQIIPTNQFRNFFSSSISEWLTSNLQLLSLNKQSASSWAYLFGIIFWHIWNNWNLIIFQGNSLSPKDIISISYSWMKHCLYTYNEGIDLQSKQIPVRQNFVTAELWGLLDGLLILQKHEYNEVIIRSDNLENVISISESKSGGSENALIRRIQQVLTSKESWFLTYVPRETNRVANALAKMALSSVHSLCIFEVPLLSIKEILQDDNSVDNSLIIHSM
ncbi:hypothetical protein J1N35_017465 [Gossypium stocksii]|uniref:RNase H type-1 domain-containing protein n=1 Tax=Gossypium stocksii TaxID=47602 RepID=A0A9D3VP35_9ROSI|nr:hypothetical protein J1N35_017465 [Gossypium stocksii]